jgi:hypothetical protein
MKKVAPYLLILTLWIASSFVPNHEHLDRSYYSCTNCCQVIATPQRPNTSGCSSQSNYGYHSWNNIGEVGQDAYGCKNCGTSVYVRSRPSTSGCCSNANYGYHSWSKY